MDGGGELGAKTARDTGGNTESPNTYAEAAVTVAVCHVSGQSRL